MSIATIDRDVYETIKQDTILRYIKHGMGITQATIHAQALMDSAFHCACAALDKEFELDSKENGIYG
jgi:hypothetical protein